MEYVEGCKLLDNNKIFFSDHRACEVDIAMEEYFSEQLSSWDDINKAMLNPARICHRDKFVDSI